MTQASAKQPTRKPSGSAARKQPRAAAKKPSAKKASADTAAEKKALLNKAATKKAATKKAGAKQPAVKAAAPAGGRRIQVRRSGVHGKGVYALQPIAKGETVIEYIGEIITWKEALRRHPHDPANPTHTFYFHLDDGHVIDGKHHGNAARWINHSCAPNCEADQEGMRVFVKALRNIKAGEELFYDYGLVIDERITPQLKREYACLCGARSCRGTMLALRR